MITRNFNLYLNAGHSVPLVINVNQYDSGEQWVFTLYNADGTKYTPSTGAIVGIKSDGLGIINSGSVVDGKVVINETEQMTAAVGKAVFELMIDSQTHGTANFIVLVEPKPGNNADLSESDLSLLQEAIDATSPLPTGGSVGQVLTKTANGSTWSNAGTPTQEQVADAVSDWADEHITVSTGVVIDTSLAVAGAAADSKKVGDEITDLKSAIQQIGGGLSAEVKQALMNCFNYVAWKDNDPNASQYINALQNALYPPTNLVSISAVYTQSGTVYDTDSLDDLKADLVVTAHYSDSTTAVVTTYVLSGTLTVGTSTITVAYGGKTTTFNVTVSEAPYVGSEYITLANETPTAGYINDSGEVASLANNYFIDKLYDALPFVFASTSAIISNSQQSAGRSAYYDASEQFISRMYSNSGTVVEVSEANAVYEKVGWGSKTFAYIFLLRTASESLFVNTDKAINASGELEDSTGQDATNLIAITGEADRFIIPVVGTVVRIAFYDSNQEFISRYFNGTTQSSGKVATGDIPTNATYFRMDKPTGVTAYHPLAKGI